MDLETARQSMSKVGWLSQQPVEFRSALLGRTTLQSFAKNEYLYHIEDSPGMMFGVVEGAVLIGIAHPIIGLYQAHLGRPGDWYGEAAALHEVKRRVAVEAAVPVQILCLPIRAVQKMLAERLQWQRNFSSLLLWNQENAIRSAADLLIRDPRARVSARLLTLCGVRTGQSPPKTAIELPVTQEQFAIMCGLSRKSVHTALNRLASEGLCENRYGGIVVLNPEALEKNLMSLASNRAPSLASNSAAGRQA